MKQVYVIDLRELNLPSKTERDLMCYWEASNGSYHRFYPGDFPSDEPCFGVLAIAINFLLPDTYWGEYDYLLIYMDW